MWSVAGSAALHGLVLVALLSLPDRRDAPAPVRTTSTFVANDELEDPPPPPPEEVPVPDRPEVEPEILTEDPPPDDAVAAEWDDDVTDDLLDRVRDVVFCPDPRAASGRFGPSRGARRAAARAVPSPVAAAPSLPPVQRVTPPPPPPPPTAATFVAAVQPQYPRAARERGLEGTVELRVVVEADGTLGDVTVVRTSGYAVLDRAAIAAVQRWNFAPATVLGRPVRATLDLPPIRFRLTD